jgi:translation elongation factor EF-G
MKARPESSAGTLRVVKKLSPQTRGALKLARQYGEELVCVRHRMDDKGEYRYTTVELLVEKTPVRPRADNIVAVYIGPAEKALQTAVRAAGATWDSKARTWRMPRRVAAILRLVDRITEK